MLFLVELLIRDVRIETVTAFASISRKILIHYPVDSRIMKITFITCIKSFAPLQSSWDLVKKIESYGSSPEGTPGAEIIISDSGEYA